jgi:hypothetical protein
MAVRVGGLKPGEYRVTTWNTVEGEPIAEFTIAHDQKLTLELRTDLAVAVRRQEHA